MTIQLKKEKKILYIFLIFCFTLFFLGSIFTRAFLMDEEALSVEGITSFDTLLWGEVLPYSSKTAVGTFILRKDNEDKNVKALYPMSKDIFLTTITEDENKVKSIENPFNDMGKFLLYQALRQEKVYLQMIYNEQERQLVFQLPAYTYNLGTQQITTKSIPFFVADNVSPVSVLKIGMSKYIPLQYYDNDEYVSLQSIQDNKKVIEVFREKNYQLLDEYVFSFESGLWQNQVYDCSGDKLPGEPVISMRLEEIDVSEGNSALQLYSSNHYACTSKSFNLSLNVNNIYAYFFDYKNKKGQKAQYYLEFTTPREEEVLVQGERKIINTGQRFLEEVPPTGIWKTFYRFIEPEYDDFDKMTALFYAPSDGEEVENLFDAVRLAEYERDDNIVLSTAFSFPSEFLINDSDLSVAGSSILHYSGELMGNLLEEYNYSFEEKLWEDFVFNCRPDLPGKPNLDMRRKQGDASDGSASLLLASSNHYACTSRIFSVFLRDDIQYRFLFDYKNVVGKLIRYNLTLQSIQKEVVFVDNKLIKKTSSEYKGEEFVAKDNNWNTYQSFLSSDVGDIKSFRLHFYAPSKGASIVNLFDNVRIYEYYPKTVDDYFFHSSNSVKENNKDIVFSQKKLGKGRYLLLFKNAPESFLVLLKERYGSEWQMSFCSDLKAIEQGIDCEVRVSEKEHYKVNNYMNGWLLDSSNMKCGDGGGCYYDGNLTLLLENTFVGTVFEIYKWLVFVNLILGIFLVSVFLFFLLSR